MALEIHGLASSTANVQHTTAQRPQPRIEEQKKRLTEQGQKIQQHVQHSQEQQKQKIQEAVDRLDSFAKSINKRLSYSFNKELNQVVVKVVDANTDKVIKELPPAELQRLHLKIQEYIGMIVDETV